MNWFGVRGLGAELAAPACLGFREPWPLPGNWVNGAAFRGRAGASPRRGLVSEVVRDRRTGLVRRQQWPPALARLTRTSHRPFRSDASRGEPPIGLHPPADEAPQAASLSHAMDGIARPRGCEASDASCRQGSVNARRFGRSLRGGAGGWPWVAATASKPCCRTSRVHAERLELAEFGNHRGPLAPPGALVQAATIVVIKLQAPSGETGCPRRRERSGSGPGSRGSGAGWPRPRLPAPA